MLQAAPRTHAPISIYTHTGAHAARTHLGNLGVARVRQGGVARLAHAAKAVRVLGAVNVQSCVVPHVAVEAHGSVRAMRDACRPLSAARSNGIIALCGVHMPLAHACRAIVSCVCF